MTAYAHHWHTLAHPDTLAVRCPACGLGATLMRLRDPRGRIRVVTTLLQGDGPFGGDILAATDAVHAIPAVREFLRHSTDRLDLPELDRLGL